MDTWAWVVSIAGGIATICGAIAAIYKIYIKCKENENQHIREISKDVCEGIIVAEVKEKFDSLENSMGVITNTIEDTNESLKSLQQQVDDVKRIQEQSIQMNMAFSNSFDIISKALQRMLRDRINQAYSHFMHVGKIDRNSLQALLEEYESYHDDFDGNSFVSAEIEELKKLPKVESLNDTD